MRALPGLLLTAVLMSAALGAEMLTPRAFTEEFARAVKAALPSATVAAVGDLELAISEPDGRQRSLLLENPYRDYSSNPQRLDHLIRSFVAALTRSGSGAGKFDPARLIPVIKDRQWLDDERRGFKARGIEQDHVVEPFNDELFIVYVEDDPTRMRYIMSGENIGVARDRMRALAIENLKRILPKIELQTEGDVAVLSAGGDYDASLLLIDEIGSGGQIKMNGDIVVAVPARDVLLVTGSRSRAGVKKVRELAAKLAAEGPHRLTATLFVYRNGKFAKFGR